MWHTIGGLLDWHFPLCDSPMCVDLENMHIDIYATWHNRINITSDNGCYVSLSNRYV